MMTFSINGIRNRFDASSALACRKIQVAGPTMMPLGDALDLRGAATPCPDCDPDKTKDGFWIGRSWDVESEGKRCF